MSELIESMMEDTQLDMVQTIQDVVVERCLRRAKPLHHVSRQEGTCNPLQADNLDKLLPGLYDAWLDAIAPHEPEKLSRRLEWSSIDSISFKKAVTCSESISAGEQDNDEGKWPRWCFGLYQIRESVMQDWDRLLDSVENSPQLKQLPFIDLWLPAVDRAVELVQKRYVGNDHSFLITASAFASAGKSVLARLVKVGEQILWYEFNLRRPPGMALLAHLGKSGDGTGNPSREYYQQFIRHHRKDGLATLLDKYPVCGRLLGTVWTTWVDTMLEMVQRISSDYELITDKFNISLSADLVDIQQGISDPHRGGRQVAILEFCSNGDIAKIVYKPKDMHTDEAYQLLLSNINNSSELPELKTISILCGGGYGYMEYVPHRICKGSDMLINFYFNAGRQSAILHILGCTDCHHENLIADQDQLVLIDCETILEGDVADYITDASGKNECRLLTPLQQRIGGSVLRTGLLQSYLFLKERNTAVDISALGILAPPDPVGWYRGWIGLNSDGMFAGRVEKPSILPSSLPVGFGEQNQFSKNLEIFCKGFYQQSMEVVDHKNNWLRQAGYLSVFSRSHRRIVLRDTRVYWAIQQQLLTPKSLQSPLNQALCIEKLASSYLLSPDRPIHWPVLEEEIKQIEDLDIPYFEHRIGDADLPLPGRSSIIRKFFENSGLTACRKRIISLDSREVNFQISLIRGSCRAQAINNSEQTRASVVSANSPHCEFHLSRQECCIEAFKVLEAIADLSVGIGSEYHEWLSLHLGEDGDSFVFGPAGLSLYGGSSGVALLAAKLSRVREEFHLPCDHEYLDRIIHGILKPIVDICNDARNGRRIRWWRDQQLGLNGCGGILLTLLGLEMEGWESPSFTPRELCERLIDDLYSEFIADDPGLDVIRGCAGLVGPLVLLGTNRSIELASVAGQHLLVTQQHNGGWHFGLTSHRMLLGFSHGTSGFIAALACLYRHTGDGKLLESAERALAYERLNFSAKHQNWPDLRSIPKNYNGQHSNLNYTINWCHGAPGIAMGRACLWGTQLWDQKVAEEVRIGLNTTAAAPLSNNDHICCGTLGLASILQYVGQGAWNSDRDAQSYWGSCAGKILQNSLSRRSCMQGQFRCFDVDSGTLIMPGFFTGLSGIGMVLASWGDSRSIVPTLISAGLYNALSN